MGIFTADLSEIITGRKLIKSIIGFQLLGNFPNVAGKKKRGTSADLEQHFKIKGKEKIPQVEMQLNYRRH